MKTIEIENQVFETLSKHRIGFETPSEVIKRLLDEITAIQTTNQPQQPIPKEHKKKNHLLDHLTSPNFLRLNGKNRYLSILSLLYEQSPPTFDRLERYRRTGNKRINFSTQESKIESSGKSTQPEKIPETPFYVLTNLDHRSKRSILSDILPEFGFSAAETQIILKAIPDSNISRPRR